MRPLDDKLESQKHWGADPCGAETADEFERGSLAFYSKVEAERYGVYVPWLKNVVAFETMGGRRVLEIGPGLGTDHAQFARAGAKLYAVGITATHLELTRPRLAMDE